MRLSRRDFMAVTTAAALVPVTAGAQVRMKVVATTGMIADAARAIGGDAVEVRALMGAGVDPHGYRQTRSDVVAMTRADLVLYHGLFLEAQMERFLNDLARKRPVIAVAETVDPSLLIGHKEYADKFDPHIWMDPVLWADAVTGVRDALVGLMPEQAAALNANAQVYLETVAALTDYGTQVLSSVPEPARVLVTAHDAFGYFGRRFGLEEVGIQGISTDAEAGLARVGTLVDLLVERGIGAVFVESSVSDRNIRALIEGAAARDHEVRIGGELYSDAMGAEGTYEGTYPGMIDHNITTIARALGGAAPERGMVGSLTAES